MYLLCGHVLERLVLTVSGVCSLGDGWLEQKFAKIFGHGVDEAFADGIQSDSLR